MGLKSKVKAFVKKNPKIINIFASVYNKLPFNNAVKNKKGIIFKSGSFLKHCKIINKGENNRIIISEGCCLENCCIKIYGSRNTVLLNNGVSARDLEIHIEDSENEVTIGAESTFEKGVHLACIEGTKLSIGEDCMFSSNISVATGDSHSVLNMNGERINPSKDVNIGNHVWVGNTVRIVKGVKLCDNTVVGVGSVVTGMFEEQNVAVAGNPAKIIKEQISWDRARI